MWQVPFVILLLVCVWFAWFAGLNTQEILTLRFPLAGDFRVNSPAWFALLLAWFGGVVTWIVICSFMQIKLRHELRRERKESRRLRNELTALRNLPVGDIETGGDVLDADENAS